MNGVNDYLEASQLQTRDATEVIEEFADEIAEMRGKCADIGCGPAIVTREVLMPRLPDDTEVIGMDISKKMIDFATMKHLDEERLSFVEFNVEADILPPGQINAYDNAVSFYCLHWCQTPRKACKNIFDLLRPGGHALVVFLARHHGLDSYLVLSKNPRYKPYMEDATRYIPYFQTSKSPREGFKGMLKEVGFEIIHCSVREKIYIYKNKDVLKRHALAINPFVDRMPEYMVEEFINDLVEDAMTRNISFTNSNNGSKDECKILDRYNLIIAYIKKPVS